MTVIGTTSSEGLFSFDFVLGSFCSTNKSNVFFVQWLKLLADLFEVVYVCRVCCRPLSLPANLIDLSVSGEDVGSEAVLDSSADSVDSAGFFRRFADHMRAVTRSRDAVYCKGATDYSFSQSPTIDNPAMSSTNQSILVLAGFDPANIDEECSTDVHKNAVNPPLLIENTENPPLLPIVAHPVTSVISSVSVSTTPTISASKVSGRKRWSDFGTRLVGFVDKILLPEVDRKLDFQVPSTSHSQDTRRSGSEERLCSLSAAHAIGRRSAACRLGNQSDTSDVIQMYSDIGRLRLQEDATQHTATAVGSVQKKPLVVRQLTNDSVLR